jgi:hypothetical protein
VVFVVFSVSRHVQVRESLSNVVSCHEVPTITGKFVHRDHPQVFTACLPI